MIVANVGLTQLITISLPVLIIIYPLAIVLILLSFIHQWFNGYSAVYLGALIPTFIVSLLDGLQIAGLDVSALTNIFAILPLFEQGIGWLVPAITGAFMGWLIVSINSKKTVITK